MTRTLTIVLFFFSGLAGLVYEILWQKQMVLLLGASAPAVTAVLTVFFLGVAFGGRLGDRVRSFRISPLRAYAGTLRNEAASFAGPLLESIQFVREYAGPPLPEGAKSVSFRVTVGSPERTLSSEEAGQIRAGIIAGMRGLGYELRV